MIRIFNIVGQLGALRLAWFYNWAREMAESVV